jgi:hypothetical protein
MTIFHFSPPPSSTAADELRAEVRAFLTQEMPRKDALSRAESWLGFDADFSRKVAERGWIGMTWPKEYGGHERSAIERYVVLEEMLAAGAPVAAHWIGDRQTGPSILRFGSESQRRELLPAIAAGACFFCIGMSEPNSGSDLASVRTRADSVDDGYRVNGAKVWTTNAHRSHYILLFCRTGEGGGQRHEGFSQFLVPLSTPGITVRPIISMSGEHHFNEVVFDDVHLPASSLLGKLGHGWAQVTAELAYERSGPERFLSSYILFVELLRTLENAGDARADAAIGRLCVHLITLRRMSRSIAGMLQNGADPALEACVVKELGALLEQEIPETARQLTDCEPNLPDASPFSQVLAYTLLSAPSFSLRGGTREILRGIIARGLGLR